MYVVVYGARRSSTTFHVFLAAAGCRRRARAAMEVSFHDNLAECAADQVPRRSLVRSNTRFDDVEVLVFVSFKIQYGSLMAPTKDLINIYELAISTFLSTPMDPLYTNRER